MAPFDLPRVNIKDVALEFNEFTKPSLLAYIERGSNLLHPYGHAHSFIAQVKDARVIASGSLAVDDDSRIIVHGLSTGNYPENIHLQLKDYKNIPDGGEVDHAVLLWGTENFGHWLFTYLLRATLLWYQTSLFALPILIQRNIPRRYLEWLERMGLRNYVFADDGVKVRNLWVPSVVTYRGHYNDLKPYIHPEAVSILRHLILKGMALPHPTKEKLYISRSKAKWRKLANEDELWPELEKRGFKRIYFEELGFHRQLDLVSRADVIVSCIGGGSPMTMFAPINCHIVEIAAPRFTGTFASRCWAHILGQPFTRIDAEEVPQSNGTLAIDNDMRVDVKKVLEAL